MADRKNIEGPAEPTRIPRIERPPAVDRLVQPRDFADGPIDLLTDLLPYLLALRRSWRTIAAVAAVFFVAGFLVTKFLIVKSYRAMAILRPTPKVATQGRLAGLMVPDSLVPPGWGGGRASEEAAEYITILQSFVFTTALIERHHVVPSPAGISLNPLSYVGSGEKSDPQWQRYRLLESRFSCEYSAKTGNIALYYEDRSAAEAQRILNYYIDDLRDQLRRHAVQDASSAIDSVEMQARAASDFLLQTQLYELIAHQMQELALAQVQADFAFSVLEPPIAPPEAFRPSIPLNCLLAAILSAIFASGWVLVTRRDNQAGPSREMARITPDDEPVLSSKVL
jgi:hypothetical protein